MRANSRALAAGGVAGMLVGAGLFVVHSPLALVAFGAAAILVIVAAPRAERATGSGQRRHALRIAVAAGAAIRALVILVGPFSPPSSWTGALALESIGAALVALRWPVHGLTLLCLSTALHRWRVVEMTWRIDELPLAIAYSLVAVVALAWSLAALRPTPSS